MIKPLAAVLAGIVISLFSTLTEACTYNRGTGQARPCPQRAAPVAVQPPPVIHGPRVWRPNVRQGHVHRGHRYRLAPQQTIRYGYRQRYRVHQHYAPPVQARYTPAHRYAAPAVMHSAGTREVCDPLRRRNWTMLIGTGDPARPASFNIVTRQKVNGRACTHVPRQAGWAVCVEYPNPYSTAADGLSRRWWYL